MVRFQTSSFAVRADDDDGRGGSVCIVLLSCKHQGNNLIIRGELHGCLDICLDGAGS